MRFTAETMERRIAASLDGPSEPPSSAEPGTVDVSALFTIPDDERFLQEAYRLILGRPYDTAGLIHYRGLLAGQTPRAVVLRHMVDSEEARRGGRVFTGLWDGYRPPAGLRHWLRRKLGGVFRSLLLRHLDPLHHKIDYLLQTSATRDDRLAALTDQSLNTLSGKLDAGTAELRTQHDQLSTRLEETGRLYADLRQQQAVLKNRVADAEALLGRKHDIYMALIEARFAELARKVESEARDLRERQRTVAASLGEEVSAIAARLRFPLVQAGHGVVATEVDGFILGMPAEEWRLAAYHVFRGVLEPGLVRLFGELVRPGMVVVDAGANIGVYTLYAARLLGGTGKVYSFEPTPRTFALLRDNVQVNGHLESGVVVLSSTALSDRQGTARLAIHPADGGHNTLFPSAAATESIEVSTTTLDEALAGEPRVDVIKMDVEGAEPRLWHGMRQVLERSPQIRILMEFAPGNLAQAGVDPAAFLNELASGGFLIERVDDLTGELRPAPPAELLHCFSANLSLRREVAE